MILTKWSSRKESLLLYRHDSDGPSLVSLDEDGVRERQHLDKVWVLIPHSPVVHTDPWIATGVCVMSLL